MSLLFYNKNNTLSEFVTFVTLHRVCYSSYIFTYTGALLLTIKVIGKRGYGISPFTALLSVLNSQNDYESKSTEMHKIIIGLCSFALWY